MAYSDFPQIDELGDTVVARLKQLLTPLGLFATVHDDEPREPGDLVRVPVLLTGQSDLTVRTKAAGSVYTADAVEPTKVDVALGAALYTAVSHDAVNKLKAARFPAVIEEVAMEQAYKLAAHVLNLVFAEVTIANYSGEIFNDLPANLDYDAVVDVWAAKNALGTFGTGAAATMILNGTFIAALLKDAAIAQHPSVAEIASDATREALIRRIAGMDIRFSEVMPDNSEALAGMVAHPSALALATSPVQACVEPGQADLLDYRLFSDSETGLTINYREVASADVDRKKRIFEVHMGVEVTNGDGILRMVDATP